MRQDTPNRKALRMSANLRMDQCCDVIACNRPAREPGHLCTRCWQGLSPLERSLLKWEAEPVADATWEMLRALADLPAFDGEREWKDAA
jgi:hypothetical protein